MPLCAVRWVYRAGQLHYNANASSVYPARSEGLSFQTACYYWVCRQFCSFSARSESTGYVRATHCFSSTSAGCLYLIWSNPQADEYSSVRDFALQKKLALMTAHNSIIAARVKQTWDANRKRQAVPFHSGDLVYLLTKHISFKKGLARKLLPKFIGPYKILKDFGNSSFQLKLPPHLKRRGIHDIFHSSLLRIHVPNDDRLFPGRMDTQLSGEDDGDEWAVDWILSHSGSRTEASFKILWKSGDVTWLPYYQITHLQVLLVIWSSLGYEKLPNYPRARDGFLITIPKCLWVPLL